MKAFQKLKEICTFSPILAHADFKKPFKLPTDPWILGLGTILYGVKQNQNGINRVIGLVNQYLSKVECKYAAHKLKFLTLKWAITYQFHEFLYGSYFSTYTNKKPLMYVLLMVRLDTTGNHWVASLANYNCAIFTSQERPIWMQTHCIGLHERACSAH